MKQGKTYRINGFDQIKAFYSWVFNNADKRVTPQHISLYLFLINQANRNNWVEWFKVPFDLGMTGACIGNKKTYYNCLADLSEWGMIKYQKGMNEWRAPLIKLEVLKCTATATATVPLPEPLPIPLPTHIYKLVTNNLKPITDNFKKFEEFILSLSEEGKVIVQEEKKLKDLFEIFRQSYPGTKRGFNPEYENFIKKNKNWHEIVPLLSDALTYQKAARIYKKDAGGFVPEWKNLQTWINQKCWEEEIEINNVSHEINRGNKQGASFEQLASLADRKGITDLAQ